MENSEDTSTNGDMYANTTQGQPYQPEVPVPSSTPYVSNEYGSLYTTNSSPKPKKSNLKPSLIGAGAGLLILALGYTTFSFSGNSDDGVENKYETYQRESEEWSDSPEAEQQVTSNPVQIPMSETPKVTDYDQISLSTPLYPREDAEEKDYLEEEDLMPEGFEIVYDAGSSSIPVPSIKNDPNGIFEGINTNSYKSSRCDIIVSESILSKTKIKELGSTDDEVTRALMHELVATTEGVEPTTVKVYDTGSKTAYIELYEFTYTDLSGKEVKYAMRAFANNGHVYLAANDCGWETQSLADHDFWMEFFIYPYYPEDDARQKD